MRIDLRIRGNPRLYRYHGANIDNKLPINLLENVPYIIGVDPSTTTTAIVIGNTVNDQADMFMELKRDVEANDTEFNKEIYTLINNYIRDNIKSIEAIIVEKPFKHPRSTTNKYAKQKANFDIWKSLSNRYEIDFYDVVPQSWRGNFTKKYGHLIQGPKNKVSKEVIRGIYASNELIDLMDMSTDTSDAYGIFKYYIDKFKGDLKASKEREREYSHHLIYVITSEEYLSEFTEEYLRQQLIKGRKSMPVSFSYCKDISPEDNIRCFTSLNNSKKYNVYVCPFTPSIDNLRYLYRYRKTIPERIDSNTQLFLVGYRLN